MMRRSEQHQKEQQRRKFLAGQTGLSVNSDKPLSNRLGFNQKENQDDELDMSGEIDEGINDSRLHTSMRSRGMGSFSSAKQSDVISEVDKQTD